MKNLLCKIFLLFILFNSTLIHAQTKEGKVIADALSLGNGKSVPLPTGEWLVKKIDLLPGTLSTHTGYLLENTNKNEIITYILVNDSITPNYWNQNFYQTSNNAQEIERYGTSNSTLVSKISYLQSSSDISERDLEFRYFNKLGLNLINYSTELGEKFFIANARLINTRDGIRYTYIIKINSKDNQNPEALILNKKAIREFNKKIVESIYFSYNEKKPQEPLLFSISSQAHDQIGISNKKLELEKLIALEIQIEKETETTIKINEQMRLAEAAKAQEQLAKENKQRDEALAQAKLNEQMRLTEAAKAQEQLAKENKQRDEALAQAKLNEQMRLAEAAKAQEQLAKENKQRDEALAQAKLNEQMRLAEAAKAQEQLAKENKQRDEALAQAKLNEQMRLAEAAKAQEQLAIVNKPGPQLTKVQQLAQLQLQMAAIKAELEKAEPSKTGSVISARRALVIGNNRYLNVSILENAVEDAAAMGESLRNLSFDVTVKTDLSLKDMNAAIRNFKSSIKKGDEVVFFYAGHGVQIGQSNFLLPVDITGESEDQIRDDAVWLDRVMDDISEKKAKFTLAMIDACRDNPFKKSGRSVGGGTRGLAPPSTANGQMIIFSAGAGQQALDKLGPNDKEKNGLFTRVFIKEMQKPGLSVDRVVRNVRNQVVELAKSVNHEQVPAIYDQVIGEFYFKP
jgi:chemotaxis protein histidine kinase CheA